MYGSNHLFYKSMYCCRQRQPKEVKHCYTARAIKNWKKLHNQNKYINQKLTQSLKKCIKILSYNMFHNNRNLDDVVSVRKKSDTQILKNYWPVSLPPICGNIFERLMYNRLRECFIENKLITSSQSGFKPVDCYLWLMAYINLLIMVWG